MASGHEEPAGVTPSDVIEPMERRGGVARLAAQLLLVGVDDDRTWDTQRLNRHLALLDERDALRYSHEVLRVAVDEPVFDEATMDLIDATLDTYTARIADPLLTWIATYPEEANR